MYTDTQPDAQHTIRAVLCDIGEVLIHKRQAPELQRWASALHLEPLDLILSVWLSPAGQRATLGQASIDEVWDEIQQLHTLTKAELEAFRRDFEACDYLDTIFHDYLQTLRRARKLALLSNAWPDARQVFGNNFGLAELADMMILSCEEGLAKPDRRIYDLAAKRLKLSHSSIIFLDDYPPNVHAAQACGMHGIVFEDREQAIAELQSLLHEKD